MTNDDEIENVKSNPVNGLDKVPNKIDWVGNPAITSLVLSFQQELQEKFTEYNHLAGITPRLGLMTTEDQVAVFYKAHMTNKHTHDQFMAETFDGVVELLYDWLYDKSFSMAQTLCAAFFNDSVQYREDVDNFDHSDSPYQQMEVALQEQIFRAFGKRLAIKITC